MRRAPGCLTIPRVVLLGVWLLTDYTYAAYQHAGKTWLMFVGLLFAPLTTLAWALIVHFGYRGTDWWPAVVIGAVLFDLGLLDRWLGERGGRGERRGK